MGTQALGVEMSASIAKGADTWLPRVVCDICGKRAVRSSALVAWHAEVPILKSGTKIADIVILDTWACVDALRGDNPGWTKLRTMTFVDLLRALARDVLPSVMPDPVAEVRMRIELVMSARPGEWLPAKRVHSKLSGQVRQGGMWTEALADLVADGKLEIRRVRSTPTASRPMTMYRWVPPAETSRN